MASLATTNPPSGSVAAGADGMLAIVPGSTVLYPDCQKWPHNPLDCRGDGPEDHDPAYSNEPSP